MNNIIKKHLKSVCMQGKWPVIISGPVASSSNQFPKECFLDVLPFEYYGFLSNHIMFKQHVAHEYWKTIRTGQLKYAREIVKKFEWPLLELIKTIKRNYRCRITGTT